MPEYDSYEAEINDYAFRRLPEVASCKLVKNVTTAYNALLESMCNSLDDGANADIKIFPSPTDLIALDGNSGKLSSFFQKGGRLSLLFASAADAASPEAANIRALCMDYPGQCLIRLAEEEDTGIRSRFMIAQKRIFRFEGESRETPGKREAVVSFNDTLTANHLSRQFDILFDRSSPYSPE